MDHFEGELPERTEIVPGESFIAQMYESYPEVSPERFNMSERQWKYVFNYLSTFNQSQAALDAGYSESMSTQLHVGKHPNVRFWISKLMKERALPGDVVLSRLADIATGDIGDFITVLPETGQVFFDMLKAQLRGKTHLIKKLKYIKHGPGAGGVEIELHDPIRALELIGKHLQMFNETNIKVDQYTIKVIREGDKGE